MKTKTLHISMAYTFVGDTSIEVPVDMTLEEAFEYAQEHTNEIPVASNAEYVPDSDDFEIEDCEFEEEAGESLTNDEAFRALSQAEREYAFHQSQQISMQTGLIGYLRADFGSTGKEFYSSWNDFRKDLKTDEFREEFDNVINKLRDGGVLSDRDTMYKFCCGHPECDYQDGRGYYGVRLDTGKYSYLMRFNPNKGEYNLYCYCYQKDWLDDHIKNAESGIRFIDPHYNNLFVIPDGGKVKVTFDNGKYIVHKCRYIDQYHVEIDGSRIYHICEFAEIMQKYGCTVNPVAENE